MPSATSPIYPWMICTSCYQTFNLRRNFVVGTLMVTLMITLMLLLIILMLMMIMLMLLMMDDQFIINNENI